MLHIPLSIHNIMSVKPGEESCGNVNLCKENYPEVARTDYEGRQHKFGQRHNACPNSPIYRKYAEALAKPHLLVVLFCLRFFCAERGRFLIAADRKGVVYCRQRA